jgi:hypothetical protein
MHSGSDIDTVNRFILIVNNLIKVQRDVLRHCQKNTSNIKYTFIHPTKCGGTAVETFFSHHYSDYIIGRGHDNACQPDNNPIIIVRCPIERFKSMFNYWKYGSHDGPYVRHTEFVEKYQSYGIKDFIQLIKTNAFDHLYQNFTWNQHFSPTSTWFNTVDYDKIIVIRYDTDLNAKIQSLLEQLNIPKKDDVILPRINVSKKEPVVFDMEDMAFIKKYYESDFILWNDVFANKELFKIVI